MTGSEVRDGRRRGLLASVMALTLLWGGGAAWSQGSGALDQGYAAWDSLLKKHVRWLPDGKQSQVNYRGFAADRAELKKILTEWSALPASTFSTLAKEQQMAFLINAYNGFTVELILSKYPDLKSIKDLGNLFQSPWKKKFFKLLGEERHLDWIEHEQLRPNYADPRVHGAVNCASIGCPALRPEAFKAALLDAQLEDGMRRFMADRSRNRYGAGKAEISAIFDWFRADFEKGHKGFNKLADLLARYADVLADAPADREKLKSGTVAISHLEYDWSLNDSAR